MSRLISIIFIGIIASASTSAQFQNIPLKNDASPQSETSCAIEPDDYQNLVGVFHDADPAYSPVRGASIVRSSNGGTTWLVRNLLVNEQVTPQVSDPSVQVDLDGNIYTSCMLSTGGLNAAEKISVIKRKFSDPLFYQRTDVTTLGQNDRPYISVDAHPTSTTKGRIYVCWIDLSYPWSIKFKVSTDGGNNFIAGQNVYQYPPESGNPENPAAGQVKVGMPAAYKDKDVFVAYTDYSGGTHRIQVKGGSPDANNIYAFEPIKNSIDVGSSFNQETKDNLKIAGTPAIAVDQAGTTHLVYTLDEPSGWKLYYARSDINTNDWTTSGPLGDFPDGEEVQPTVAVNANGDVSIAFYHMNAARDIDYYVMKSRNNGISFSPPLKLSNAPMNIAGMGEFGGDYQGYASNNEVDFGIWTDWRNDRTDVYGAVSHSISSGISSGWNMVSVPNILIDNTASRQYPDPPRSASVYKFQNGYQTVTTLENGIGFWLKSSTPTMVDYQGGFMPSTIVDLAPAWNLIGSVSLPVDVNQIQSYPSGNISQFFKYSPGDGYETVTTLDPGLGV